MGQVAAEPTNGQGLSCLPGEGIRNVPGALRFDIGNRHPNPSAKQRRRDDDSTSLLVQWRRRGNDSVSQRRTEHGVSRRSQSLYFRLDARNNSGAHLVRLFGIRHFETGPCIDSGKRSMRRFPILQRRAEEELAKRYHRRQRQCTGTQPSLATNARRLFLHGRRRGCRFFERGEQPGGRDDDGRIVVSEGASRSALDVPFRRALGGGARGEGECGGSAALEECAVGARVSY
mmetsp:Transcript_35030/g.59477  ORF Transcript_35030/g.59477 Transcript_35030/m.59477 type:complete len:231 (+) Transcript_35030:323-1015(+)